MSWHSEALERAKIPGETDPAWARTVAEIFGTGNEASRSGDRSLLAAVDEWSMGLSTCRSFTCTPKVESDARRRLLRDVERVCETAGLPDQSAAKTVCESHPVLLRVVGILAHHWRASLTEFLERAADDFDEISAVLANGESLGKMRKLSSNLSDRHCNGRVVLVAEFESGHSVVYKPRDRSGDEVFNQFLKYFDDMACRPGFRTPSSIIRPGYAWFENIKAEEAVSETDTEHFWWRAGALTCVLHILSGRDFHRDNVIHVGEHPVLVDAESLFHPVDHSDPSDGHPVVMKTGMTPYWRAIDDRRHQLGGIGTPPPNYVDDFLEGFSEIAQFVIENRDSLLSDSGPLSTFENRSFRAILRNTATYASILHDAMQPDCLASGIAWFDAIGTGIESHDRPSDAAVARLERLSLANLDIPCFAANCSQTHLIHDGRRSIDNYFRIPGMTTVRRRIHRMDDEWITSRANYLQAVFAIAAIEPAFR